MLAVMIVPVSPSTKIGQRMAGTLLAFFHRSWRKKSRSYVAPPVKPVYMPKGDRQEK